MIATATDRFRRLFLVYVERCLTLEELAETQKARIEELEQQLAAAKAPAGPDEPPAA